MNRPVRTCITIRKADVEIYKRVKQFNFSEFVSNMFREHGQEYVYEKMQKLSKLVDK